MAFHMTAPLHPTDDNDDKASTLSLQLSGRPKKNGTEKNDERQNKDCQRGKKTTKQVVVLGPPIKIIR